MKLVHWYTFGFGKARRGLGGAAAHPVSSSLYQTASVHRIAVRCSAALRVKLHSVASCMHSSNCVVEGARLCPVTSTKHNGKPNGTELGRLVQLG